MKIRQKEINLVKIKLLLLVVYLLFVPNITLAQRNLIPLYSWWSPSREDNFSTTHPSWAGSPADTRRTPDYRFVRVEGLVFNPSLHQPLGTVKLYSWYSPSRGDNFITTDSLYAGSPGDKRKPDYHFVRMEGYIYSKPLAGTLPLHSWWSNLRGDNYATTRPEWIGSLRDRRSPDYSLYRTEGYLIPSSILQPPDLSNEFGFGTMKFGGKIEAKGQRPLLVILMGYPDVLLRHSQEEYERLFFGPDYPNICGYFSEISQRKFKWSKAGIVSVIHPKSRDVVYTIGGSKGRGDAIKLAAEKAQFDFSRYDKNNDRRITPDELGIALIDSGPASHNGGQSSFTDPSCIKPKGSKVEICAFVSACGEDSALMNFAHELAHQIADTQDIYGAHGNSFKMSLKAATVYGRDNRDTFHLDPWHKMRLGWVRPEIYSISISMPGSSTSLRAPQGHGYKPLIFYNPDRGTNEYLILEFRNHNSGGFGSYDRNAADRGVAVWYVKTDKNKKLIIIPAIGGGNDATCFLLGSPDQGRGVSHLWRQEHGEIRLRWLDGTDSGLRFRVGPMSNTSPYVDVEWTFGDQPFIPRIDKVRVSGRSVRPGSLIPLDGVFGIRGTRIVSFKHAHRSFELPIESWTYSRISVRVPNDIPSGDYRLLIYNDTSHRIASNAVTLTVVR